MSQYFEILNNNDDRVVIDDSFKNLMLLYTIPGTAAKRNEPDRWGNYIGGYYYTLPCPDNKGILYGIGLDGLEGLNFALYIEAYKTNSAKVSFFNPRAFHYPDHPYFTEFRDDIIARTTFYVFGEPPSTPATHLSGLEVYNAQGQVVYTSSARYLNVLRCNDADSEYVGKSPQEKNIGFVLGYDYYQNVYIDPHIGESGVEYHQYPNFAVDAGGVLVKRTSLTESYVDDVDPDMPNVIHHYQAHYCYNYMIGSVQG